jgi:TPR repeat protein
MNAVGYIYFKAPDALEIDPVKTNSYGSIRRDLKKAKTFFEKAAIKGNVNALYNMGCLYLSSSGAKS